ncbi:MAG TPA: hypothetical protein VNM36_12430 [Gemmatimonadaceae bacterium]|nr:hypothetical protein [Gemmatimonadaceae bacterium]
MTREDLKALAEEYRDHYAAYPPSHAFNTLATEVLVLLDEGDALRKMADAAEMLWSVVANVSEGDWTKQSPEWQEAAAHWRNNYFAALDHYLRVTRQAQP